jgi:predicted RNA-binding Zn ribbon-like protein
MTGPCLDERSTVSLAFANTGVPSGDAADAAGQLTAWLQQHGLLDGDGEVTRAELARFRMLRDAVRNVLHARVEGRAPDSSAVRVIDAAALAAPGTTIGVWDDDGSVSRGWRSTGGDPLDRAAATIAADVVDVVVDHGERLGLDGDGADARLVLRAGQPAAS